MVMVACAKGHKRSHKSAGQETSGALASLKELNLALDAIGDEGMSALAKGPSKPGAPLRQRGLEFVRYVRRNTPRAIQELLYRDRWRP